jgi:nucleotide-binding universal stress UspA family protein
MSMAQATGAKVVVLSVAEPRLYRASDRDSLQTGAAAEAEHLEWAQRRTDMACAAAEGAGVQCERVVSVSASPEDEILKASRRFNCDLIVMATRGKTGVIDTLFSESTTQQVIRQSGIPVLVFP